MFTSVRSVLATIGRMSSRAASSIKALTGKQNKNSVPSAFRTLATAAAAFMGVSYVNRKPSFRCRIMIEHLNRRSFVRNSAPDNQAAARARFHDAPLLADADGAARQVLLVEIFANAEFGDIAPSIETAV